MCIVFLFCYGVNLEAWVNTPIQIVMKRTTECVICSLVAIALMSCQSNSNVVFDDDNQGMILPKQVNNTSDKTRFKLEKELQKKGVKIISMGQEYLISTPSNLLFYANTPRIRWQSYALLNQIACYMKLYRKVSVSVIAHTAKAGPDEMRNQSLSVARARNVADYLWSQAIDARFVSMQGMGSEKPVVNPSLRQSVVENSRVEITFRNVIV